MFVQTIYRAGWVDAAGKWHALSLCPPCTTAEEAQAAIDEVLPRRVPGLVKEVKAAVRAGRVEVRWQTVTRTPWTSVGAEPEVTAVPLEEQARALLVLDAAPHVVQQVRRAEALGTGVWEPDPDVDGVAGFVAPGTRRAAVVVYLDARDFEVDEGLLANFATRKEEGR